MDETGGRSNEEILAARRTARMKALGDNPTSWADQFVYDHMIEIGDGRLSEELIAEWFKDAMDARMIAMNRVLRRAEETRGEADYLVIQEPGEDRADPGAARLTTVDMGDGIEVDLDRRGSIVGVKRDAGVDVDTLRTVLARLDRVGLEPQSLSGGPLDPIEWLERTRDRMLSLAFEVDKASREFIRERKRLQHAAVLRTEDSIKSIRETLCVAQSAIGDVWRSTGAHAHMDLLGRLIDECDRQRPLGPDGKHGDRHTATCGCDDLERPIEQAGGAA